MQLFNVLHIIMMILMIPSAILIFLYFNRLELDEKITRLTKLAYAGFIIFVIRFFLIMFDKTYNYNFFGELPLNPVDLICIFGLVIYGFKKYKYISVMYYLGILWSLMMIIFPSNNYLGKFFAVRNLLYCANLYINLVLTICTLAIYKPKFNDIFNSIKVFFISITFAFIISFLLQIFGLYKEANYLYTLNGANNALFNLFYNLVPISYLYTLIILALFWILFYVMYGLNLLLEKPIHNIKKKLNKDVRWYVLDKKIIKKELV